MEYTNGSYKVFKRVQKVENIKRTETTYMKPVQDKYVYIYMYKYTNMFTNMHKYVYIYIYMCLYMYFMFT